MVNPLNHWDAARRCIAIGQYEQAQSYLTALILDPKLPGTLVPLVQSDLQHVEQFLRRATWSRLVQWLRGRRRVDA